MKAAAVRGCVFLFASFLSTTLPGGTEPVFPGSSWERRKPAEVGLDGEKLKAFSNFAGGRGCVVRHGYMVYTWELAARKRDATARGDVASAAKPLYSHFLFKALEEKRIPGLDEKVARWEPRLKEINRDLGYKDREITWRHLANQTSCYGLAERPGAAFCYNDWQMALFWDTLFLKVYGATLETVDEKVLRPGLTGPLQCQDRPTFLGFGPRDRPGRAAISPRDFARFGLLYLRGGNWRGKQLIGRRLAKMAVTSSLPNSIPRAGNRAAEMIAGQRSIGSRRIPDNQTDHMGSYSWLWWTNGIDRQGKRHWPDVPEDTFGAFGHGGLRAMVVIPGLDLIVSWNDTGVNSREKENRALQLLIDSCTASSRSSRPSGTGAPGGKSSSRGSGGKSRGGKNLGALGPFPLWGKVEIPLAGPESRGRGDPNPFSILVDVTFTSPGGKKYVVPGFYQGDGKGGLDGDTWMVRFSADETGPWTFLSRSSHPSLRGYRGIFRAVPPPRGTRGFYRWGRLEAVGTASDGIRYLKFRGGPYWLKAGCDDPENFLGRTKNYGSPARRKAAVEYLARRGINSLYLMTHNLDGDGRDVWPWLGRDAGEARRNGGRDARFDIAKLEEWRELFEHMQALGVVPYLVLEDDSAWKGYDHQRYYREMVARFGDLPALIFNFNEEHNENYSLPEALGFLKKLEEIDPYNHPRGIHNVNRPDDRYIDAAQVHFTSIQTGSGGREGEGDPLAHNQLALDWIHRCRERGRRILMVGFDEARPEEDRRGWWSAYLGGGVWEAHVKKPYDRPLKDMEPVWMELGGARAFMESIPFWEMAPRNDLVKAGAAFCLARPGAAYALYLPRGGAISVELASGGKYECAWWSPRNGRDGDFQNPDRAAGGLREFRAPGKGDWALRILRGAQE